MHRILALFSNEQSTAGVIRAAVFALFFALLLLMLMRLAHHDDPKSSAYEAGPARTKPQSDLGIPKILKKVPA